MTSVLLIFLLFFTSLSNAEDDLGIGIGLGVFLFSPDDPSGDADVTLSVTPLSIYYTTELGRDTRIMSNFTYLTYDVDASTTSIGQEVTRVSLTAMYQSRFRVSRSFKPWLGLGLTFGTEEFENRFTIDKDGFLDQSFANRKESGVALELDFTNDITLFNTDFIFRAAYTNAFYEGSSGFQSSIIWTY